MTYKTWKEARKVAQAEANERGANRYVFQDSGGRIDVDFDYPKSGIEFETFKPQLKCGADLRFVCRLCGKDAQRVSGGWGEM